jgi:hypothetical protein
MMILSTTTGMWSQLDQILSAITQQKQEFRGDFH